MATNQTSKKNGTSGKKKMTAKQRAARKRKKVLIFTLEIIVLLVMLVVLWGVLKTENVGKVNIKEEDIEINSTVEENVAMKGYRTIALFGVDSTTGQLTKNTRSDTIMICSINQDTGDIKLVSVYRDTYLNIGNDTYNKCNAAYAKGGPEQAINMLNMNLDLNITDFVTVGFAGLMDVVDALGGIYMNITDAEISHLNNYQSCIADDLGLRSYTKVTSSGYQLLNGLQATAYCRIRYTAGDDFRRAERQRDVMYAIAEEAKQANVSTLTSIANAIFESNEVYTSLDLAEIVELLGDIAKYQVVSEDDNGITAGFPQESMRTTGRIGSVGSSVVPLSLADNVVWLHEYLFGEENYEPSDEVKAYSERVASDTSKYLK